MRIRDFISHLAARGDLLEIKDAVPKEAIPGLIQDEERARNRAILFSDVQGYEVPTVANLYATLERYALAVGAEPDGLWEHIESAIRQPVRAIEVGDGPCFEVIHKNPDVTRILPLVQYSERDGGPYITSGLVFMKDPDTGRRVHPRRV